MITRAIDFPEIKKALEELIEYQDDYCDYYLDWLLEDDKHLERTFIYHVDGNIIDIITTYEIKNQKIVCPYFMDYDHEEKEMKDIDSFFGNEIILSSEYFDFNKYGYLICNDKSSFSEGHTYGIRGFYTKNDKLINFLRDEFEKNTFPEFNEDKIEYLVINSYEKLYELICKNNNPVDNICSPYWRNSSNVQSVAGFHYFQIHEVYYPVLYLIAVIDNKPVGIIKMATESEKNTRQYLCYIDVNKKYHRRGVANKLINKLKEFIDKDKPLVVSGESEAGKRARMLEHFKAAGYPVSVYTEKEYEDILYKEYFGM